MNELQKNSLIPVLKDLEHLFDIFNDHFFEGTLKPAVIIASTSGRKNAFGWCTTWKAWTANNKKDIHSLSPTPEELEILNEQDGYYEINLCAEYAALFFTKWFIFIICRTISRTRAEAESTTTADSVRWRSISV